MAGEESDHFVNPRDLILHIVVNIAIGADIQYQYGAIGRSVAWQWWDERVPAWMWPAIFYSIAVISMFGFHNRLAARLSFYWAGVAMALWAILLLWLWWTRISPTLGSAVLVGYLAYLKIRFVEASIFVERERHKDSKINTLIQDARKDVSDASGR